jgi:cytochrome c peroxidase
MVPAVRGLMMSHWLRALQRFGIVALTTGFVLGPLRVAGQVVAGAAAIDSVKTGNAGKHLFEKETFGGNGRTCRTCHSRETGTVSPDDAQARFVLDPKDPLFLADGSDDGAGNGVTRMLIDATILMRVPLAANVSIVGSQARTVTLRRGIPTTLNTPALDPVLMYDGRQPNLQAQALGAIGDHANATKTPTAAELDRIAQFELTDTFFSSDPLKAFARTGVAPALPAGTNDSERRGRRFFEDVPLGPGDSKQGICAICHSGPMLNETNQFIPGPPFGRGGRFQSILVSEFNTANNPVITFSFRNTDGTFTEIASPDPGRALITGNALDPQSLNAFKIPTLWGVARTAPYFHDNSAKTLEDVMRHYQAFFATISDPAVDGDDPIILTQQDMSDIIAFMQLLK